MRKLSQRGRGICPGSHSVILSALWLIRIRGLWKLPDGRDWLWGKLGLVLMGGAMLSKSLIQFSVDDGQGCVPFLLFDWRANYGGGNEGNDNLLQKVPCTHCRTQFSRAWGRPELTHASAGASWTLTGKPGSVSVGSLHLSPGSWCPQGFVCALQVCFPSPVQVL